MAQRQPKRFAVGVEHILSSTLEPLVAIVDLMVPKDSVAVPLSSVWVSPCPHMPFTDYALTPQPIPLQVLPVTRYPHVSVDPFFG